MIVTEATVALMVVMAQCNQAAATAPMPERMIQVCREAHEDLKRKFMTADHLAQMDKYLQDGNTAQDAHKVSLKGYQALRDWRFNPANAEAMNSINETAAKEPLFDKDRGVFIRGVGKVDGEWVVFPLVKPLSPDMKQKPAPGSFGLPKDKGLPI